jgi:tetratricopeptide (TPR) repeat protein
MQCEHPEALKRIDALIFKTTNPNAHMMLLGAKLNHLVRLGRFGDVLGIIKIGKMSAAKNGEHPWMFLLCEAWLQILCCNCDGLRRSSASLMGSEAGQHNAQARTVAMVAAGYAELYEEKYGKALECFTQVCDSRITPGFFLQWYWRLHGRFGMAEAHLQAGDLFRAQNDAQDFLESALSAGDPTMHALAWEINSRVASTKKDHGSARECIDKALAILDKFDVPIVSWRVYRTAWDLCISEESLKAEEYRARAKEVIRRLENSFELEEPLRESLMRAAEVRHILGQAVSA